MADIVLTTFNAKFIHAAFGLRYLLANLGALQSRAVILEFDLHQRPLEIVESVLAQQPRIVGIGVYIWNAGLSLEVVNVLKRLHPEVKVVLGGPEVSYETESQPITVAADYVIAGEGDVSFARLCRELLEGGSPQGKVISAELPALAELRLPYALYDDRDVAHRVIYVEASRGCPFTCEFCLSSLEIPVRQFPLPALLGELELLLKRGTQQFKFVDRTFNLNLNISLAILEFFQQRHRPGLFLHFEMVPDRLPEALRDLIRWFPAGSLQLEVGVQTFNEDVAGRIRRRQNYEKLEENLRFLRAETGVHIHADLIAGLPGESIRSFGEGFDRLVRLDPQEIQVGILKRLRGTPIVRHDEEWQMIYSPFPPYEILQNRSISFPEMQRMRRFARAWDLVANSGNFVETTPLLWQETASPFQSFMRWSEWLHRRAGRSHGISLVRLAELLFLFLVEEQTHDPRQVAQTLWRDYQSAGRSDRPVFLRPYLPQSAENGAAPHPRQRNALKRQRRHQGR